MATAEASGAPEVSRRSNGWLIGWGLVVWAGVFVTIRLVGHRLLAPDAPTVVAAFFVATVPLMAAVTYPVYLRFDIEVSRRPHAAAIMSVPGMLLDVLLVAFAGYLLPNLSTGAVINFAAILLFGYAVVLLTGFVHRR